MRCRLSGDPHLIFSATCCPFHRTQSIPTLARRMQGEPTSPTVELGAKYGTRSGQRRKEKLKLYRAHDFAPKWSSDLCLSIPRA